MSLAQLEKEAGIITGITNGLKNIGELGRGIAGAFKKAPALQNEPMHFTQGMLRKTKVPLVNPQQNMVGLSGNVAGPSSNIRMHQVGNALSTFAQKSPLLAYGAPMATAGYMLGRN